MFNVKWGVKVFLLASFCVGSLFKVTVRTVCYNTLFFPPLCWQVTGR